MHYLNRSIFVGLLIALVPMLVNAQASSNQPDKTFATLSFGPRVDVTTWESGMSKDLKVKKGYSINKDQPSDAEIKDFFSRDDDWLFFGGHMSGQTLFNHAKNIDIDFQEDYVLIKRKDKDPIKLVKGQGFKQSPEVIFWGGCSVHGNAERIKILRSLFGNDVVMVGWDETTGWQIVDINCGGGGDNRDQTTPNMFFSRMGGKADPQKVTDAWLNAADSINWGKDAKDKWVRPKFSVVDSTGKKWGLIGESGKSKGIEQK